MVSCGGGQTGNARRQARRRSKETRHYGLAAFARVAPASFAGYTADPRNIFGRASRRKHCRSGSEANRRGVERDRRVSEIKEVIFASWEKRGPHSRLSFFCTFIH